MALIRCPKCGTEVSGSAGFCVHCGCKIADRAAETGGVPDPARDFDEFDGIMIEKRSLFGYYLKCFREYVMFSGRARRKEFWGFTLFYFIFLIAASVIDVLLLDDDSGNGFFFNLYRLIWFIPGMAVLWRRLHDVGHSGWYALLILLPIVGWVFILIAVCADGDGSDNQYGENPKFPDSMFKTEEL